jgi:hypothetical protein
MNGDHNGQLPGGKKGLDEGVTGTIGKNPAAMNLGTRGRRPGKSGQIPRALGVLIGLVSTGRPGESMQTHTTGTFLAPAKKN